MRHMAEGSRIGSTRGVPPSNGKAISRPDAIGPHHCCCRPLIHQQAGSSKGTVISWRPRAIALTNAAIQTTSKCTRRRICPFGVRRFM
jgi:hypothetical protein